MPEVATPLAMTNFAAALTGKPVRFWNEPVEFATFLASLTGPQFISFDAVYDMDETGKMVKKHRVTKLPNPYLGLGLKKYSTTQATVCFDYEAKVEARDGQLGSGLRDPWSLAILVNGKPSPLSTHKADVTEGPEGEYRFVPNPRLYLRCEFVRAGEGETREDKPLRTKSEYLLPDGTIVPYTDVEPYLPVYGENKSKTDFKLPKLSNLAELRAAGTIWRKWQPVGVAAQ